ncbi:MAG: NusA-like transcription termination signal-binding factor [Candidatus Micrarchaeia archaeon]
MSERKLSQEDIQLMNFLERATGAAASDVLTEGDSVIFIVAKGQLGRAIGKGGANIQNLRRAMQGKEVEIVEEAADVKELLTRALSPAMIKGMEQNDKGEVLVSVEPKSKGLAIGKGGERIKKARLLAKRLFGVAEVRIL